MGAPDTAITSGAHWAITPTPALDIVVAGQAGNFYAPAIGMSANGFKTIIDIDLNGTFNVYRAAFEYLRKPGASLIAITAPEAVRPLPFQSHVCAAKAGVNMLTKCLAIEWGPSECASTASRQARSRTREACRTSSR